SEGVMLAPRSNRQPLRYYFFSATISSATIFLLREFFGDANKKGPTSRRKSSPVNLLVIKIVGDQYAEFGWWLPMSDNPPVVRRSHLLG
ncbi:MAG: hypothetical protein ACI9HK_005426, partial [Pirellulaceae bacterium]